MTTDIQQKGAEAQNIMHFTFNTFAEMETYGKEWSFRCQYRLGNRPLHGQYDIFQNENYQLAKAIHSIGLMSVAIHRKIP